MKEETSVIFPQWVKENVAMALDTVTACSAKMWNPGASIRLRLLIFCRFGFWFWFFFSEVTAPPAWGINTYTDTLLSLSVLGLRSSLLRVFSCCIGF